MVTTEAGAAGADGANAGPDAPLPSLDRIGVGHGTDKSSLKHHYLDLYDRALAHRRLEPIRLLEIGVFKGASVRTWRDYFPNGRIVGLDIDPDALQHAGPRIEIVLGDQADPEGLRAIVQERGPFDVIIDDGSHIWRHQIDTLRALLALVTPGGLYILEDLHTSFGPYRPDYGAGGGETAAAYVLRLAERLLSEPFDRRAEEDDPFLASVPRLVRSIEICNRTALFHRR